MCLEINEPNPLNEKLYNPLSDLYETPVSRL